MPIEPPCSLLELADFNGKIAEISNAANATLLNFSRKHHPELYQVSKLYSGVILKKFKKLFPTYDAEINFPFFSHMFRDNGIEFGNEVASWCHENLEYGWYLNGDYHFQNKWDEVKFKTKWYEHPLYDPEHALEIESWRRVGSQFGF